MSRSKEDAQIIGCNLIFLIVFFGGLWLFGTFVKPHIVWEEKRPKVWDIVMTRPDGEQEITTVSSFTEPTFHSHWGGQTSVSYDDERFVPDKQITAPVGWKLEIKAR